MSEEERQALLARMKASIEEARKMTREEARARLADETLRVNQAFADAFGAKNPA